MDELHDLSDDELWSMLSERVGRDRIDVLLELSVRASQRHEHERETTLLQEVESTATELGDSVLVARALAQQGAAAYNAQDLAVSVDRYARAAQGFSDAGLSLDAAMALWGQADALRAAGEFQPWLEAAEQCRALAEFEEHAELAGDACYQQARALYALDRDLEALDACSAGRDHYRRAGMPDRVAVIDDFALTVNMYLGRLDDALEIARGCLVLARTSSSAADDPYARQRLADVFLQRGELEPALHEAEAAKAEYRQQDDLLGVARCERLRAEALVIAEQYDRALEAFADARVLFDATGHDREALHCDVRHAIVLHGVGQYQRAARINERLVAGFREIGRADEDIEWSVVRLLDNLHEDGSFQECLEQADRLQGVWPDSVTPANPIYREYLGLLASAMERVGRVREATDLAGDVIDQTPAREASVSTAYCYEIRGRSRLDSDEVAASQDFSHAIALHLAKGRVDRARELSEYFLPVDAAAAFSTQMPQGRARTAGDR